MTLSDALSFKVAQGIRFIVLLKPPIPPLNAQNWALYGTHNQFGFGMEDSLLAISFCCRHTTSQLASVSSGTISSLMW